MNILGEQLVFSDPYELVEYFNKVIRESVANQDTSKMLGLAHEYVQRYCMPQGLGNNVWHTILKDAIRMREKGIK
jgi:hypothetical protein